MSTPIQPVPFSDLLAVSRAHREAHGCSAYPYDKGALLQVVAGMVAPGRVVEVGTAIGYTAICIAEAVPGAHVDTIDKDPQHVEMARANIRTYGYENRISVHCGDAEDILPGLVGESYDLAFFDGYAPTSSAIGKLKTLLRTGGVLVCANMTLGGEGDVALADTAQWLAYSLGETALAVKR